MKKESTKEFVVKELDTLLNFLYKNVENKSKNNIKSLLKNKNILVNNVNQTQFDFKLNKNDIVKIQMSQINTRLKNNIDIIYEDDEIIVINKPHNLLSISTEKEKEFTAYKMVMTYLKSKNKNNKVFVIHRLDKATSGILMFAKDEKTKHVFQDNWNESIISRKYYAIIEGKLEKKEGKIESFLKENKSFNVYSDKSGKLAVTNYKVIKFNKDYSLLDINIETGRKNQIRVHLQDIKHPIVGDKKYSSTNNYLKRLGLHAYKLELNHPITKKKLSFETQLPIEFRKMFK